MDRVPAGFSCRASERSRMGAGWLRPWAWVQAVGLGVDSFVCRRDLVFAASQGLPTGRQAAVSNRQTGMPSFLALSARFPVMPEPGKTMTPFGMVARS